jgi:hypothetical protein
MEKIKDRKVLLFNSIIELEKKIDLCPLNEYESLIIEYKSIMSNNVDVLEDIGFSQYVDSHKFIKGYIESNDFNRAKKELKADLSQVRGGLSIN